MPLVETWCNGFASPRQARRRTSRVPPTLTDLRASYASHAEPVSLKSATRSVSRESKPTPKYGPSPAGLPSRAMIFASSLRNLF